MHLDGDRLDVLAHLDRDRVDVPAVSSAEVRISRRSSSNASRVASSTTRL